MERNHWRRVPTGSGSQDLKKQLLFERFTEVRKAKKTQEQDYDLSFRELPKPPNVSPMTVNNRLYEHGKVNKVVKWVPQS